jgi:hypothetical protein
MMILKGKTTGYIDEFYQQNGSWQAFISSNPVALLEFVVELQSTGESSVNTPLGWVTKMLSLNQRLLPAAPSLVEDIRDNRHGGEKMAFYGVSCVPFEEEEEEEYYEYGDERRLSI